MAQTAHNTIPAAQLVKLALEGLPAREQDVLRKRYGLEPGHEEQTLAAVGGRYGVTRERVRQIEALGLVQAEKNIKKQTLRSFAEQGAKIVDEAGGIYRESEFLPAFRAAIGDKTPEAEFAQAAKFILDVSGKVIRHREDDRFYAFWCRNESEVQRLARYTDKLASVLKAEREELFSNPNAFLAAATAGAKPFRFDEATAQKWVAASKRFVANAYGDWGIAEWPEANPKTARDWAYLVLKKEQKPFHFTELARIIKKFRQDKVTNVQTVHNELIKDKRFMLVGRGSYGLFEFGIIPGTAREVIAHFLKKHGPLKFSELAKIILRERSFKESTILINLQNREFFRKLEDGRYTVSEA